MAPVKIYAIQVPLRRYLYKGRFKSISDELISKSAVSDSISLASKLQLEVKLESDSWVSDLEGASTESDCTIVEALSTPVKPWLDSGGRGDCVLVGEVTAKEKAESRKQRKNYDQKCHFQDSRAAKLPWVEAVVRVDGSITQVRCKVCSDVEAGEKLLVPKIDNLYIHVGRRRAMADIGKVRRGEYYYLRTNQFASRMRGSTLPKVGRLSSRRCLPM